MPGVRRVWIPWCLALALTGACDRADEPVEVDASAEAEPPAPEPAKADDAKEGKPVPEDPKSDGADDGADVVAAADATAGQAGGMAELVSARVDALEEGGGSTGGGEEPLDPEDPAAPGEALPPLPTGAMAVVGTTTIPMTAFHEIYDLKLKKYAERGRAVPVTADRRYRQSIAERLIHQQLLADEIARIGVTIDATEVAERMVQARRGIKDWAKHLERRGESEASLEALFVAESREKAILQAEGALAVSAAEIKADYATIKDNWDSSEPRARASHILVPIVPTGAPEPSASERARLHAEAKKTADELYAKATAKGADFGALAKRYSTGPSAEKGGDIGIFTHDRMVEAFSDAAFALEPGRIAKPVESKFGFHIIKLTGKWGPGVLPQSALEDQIRERLQQRKLHQGRRELKERLLASAAIVDHIEPTLGPAPARRQGVR